MDTKTMLRRFVEEDTVVRSYVMVACGSPQDAEDILQNIWRVLLEKIDVYDESRPLRAWAMGIARVEVLKWRQWKVRRRECLSERAVELLESTAVEMGADLDERAELVEDCLSEAPELWRKVLFHKYFDQISIRDISDRLSRSVSAIEMLLVRARRGLRECVERKMRLVLRPV